MAEFAYIKFLKSEGEGDAKTQKVHTSQIHKFHEIQYTIFQTYKVEVKPGVIKHATVLFVADSEIELDKLIERKNRIREPNKKYLTAAFDTTDSETDSKKIIKRKIKTSALSDRMESLKRKQEDQCLPFPVAAKIPKIIDIKILKSDKNIVKASTTKETSKDIDKKRIPFQIIDNNKQVLDCSSTPPVKSIEERNNIKNKVSKRMSSRKIQGANAVTLKVDASGKEMDIRKKGEETTTNNVMNPLINLKKLTSANKNSKIIGKGTSENKNYPPIETANSPKKTSKTIINTTSVNKNSPAIGSAISKNKKSPIIGNTTSAHKTSPTTLANKNSPAIKSATSTDKKPKINENATSKNKNSLTLGNAIAANKNSPAIGNKTQISASIFSSKNIDIRPTDKKSAPKKGKVSNTSTSVSLDKIIKKTGNVTKKVSTEKLPEKIQDSNSVTLVNKTKVNVSGKEMDITETPKNLKNPKITEHKSTFVEKNSSNDQYDQHLNIDLKATESNFKKLVIDRQKERGTQHLLKENDSMAKLADLLKKTKQLLKHERVKNENLNEVITSLKSEVQQLEEKLVAAESYSERIMKLNKKWQALSMNKYAAIHDMFDQIINHQDFRSEEIQLQPGYITEDRSFIHMGRGEWISYATYLLSMNGVTYKSRKTFPRNLCVAVFGYDLLRKCTVTGEGSNRNRNVKKPTEKLDPNKVLAIKDIYKHFLINELGLNKDDAESESCQLNKIIAKKIAFIKGLYQKNKTDARPLLGENGEQMQEKEGNEDYEKSEGEDDDDNDKHEDTGGDEKEGKNFDSSDVDEDEEEVGTEKEEGDNDNNNNKDTKSRKEKAKDYDENDDDETAKREKEEVDDETDEREKEKDDDYGNEDEYVDESDEREKEKVDDYVDETDEREKDDDDETYEREKEKDDDYSDEDETDEREKEKDDDYSDEDETDEREKEKDDDEDETDERENEKYDDYDNEDETDEREKEDNYERDEEGKEDRKIQF